MRGTIRMICLTVTTMILAAFAVAPAAAVPSGTVSYRWMTCPAGTATTARLDTVASHIGAHDNRLWLSVGGEVFPCRPPQTLEAWGLALYYGDHAVGRAQPFQLDPGTGTDHGGTMLTGSTVQAVCILSDETTRLACAAVSWVDIAGTPSAVYEGSLPVDSPLVAMPAPTNMLVDGPGGPYCPKCP
ncbi:hypothetical protein [Catellatospora vulcania]|uniref:hypothetical protein n=1 Tax=Catellatospora vulcania TaxID=1460450 RepID=UPI0012D44998|nr:hypothetical protein [Catellatospora vulcania]